jgi:hypothetical protein
MYNSVEVVVYGWFGELEPRDSNGELSEVPQPVQYVQYDEELFTMIADANIFNPLIFRVEFKPNSETTQPPDDQTEEPSVEAGGIPTVVILSVAVGGGLGVMVIFLIIVLVCVFGRRRGKDKPKRKKRRR